MKLKILLFSALFYWFNNVVFSQNSYKSVDLQEYFVGDTLVLGTGNPLDAKYISVKYTGVPNDTTQIFRPMPKISNTKVVIKRIFTNKYGEVCFETLSKSNYYYRMAVDRAISNNEILSKNKSFKTSREAMIELKKAKEKLDLGLITTKEYDLILADLKKYIKD